MKILVLAGGADQIALINELKTRGHEIVLVDYFENPPAKAYADKHIVASTLDLKRIEEIAADEKIDLICTACTDQALLTVAYISEKLNLPCYISYQTSRNVTNKSYMKKVMMRHNIPTAKFIILKSVKMPAVKDFQYPLIVKPADCNSSKGVKRVDSDAELQKYLEEAISLSRTKTAIIEEFKIGEEISADFYIENGIVKYLSATTSFKIPNRKSFTILGSAYPAVNENQKNRLIDIAVCIAKAFELDNSPLLVQFIVNGDDISVIEFSARMGGGSKYKLIESLSGVNIMSKYVDRILGDFPSIVPSERANFCKMVYTYCTPGVIDHIEGIDDMKKRKVIDDYFLYKTKGMQITGSENSGDRPLGYLVTADTAEELDVKIKEVDRNIKVIDVNGLDILIHNLV